MKLLLPAPLCVGILSLFTSALAGFGEWTSWSVCSKSCGGGLETRHRPCLAKPCMGQTLERRSCNLFSCECNADTPLCQCVDDDDKCPGWGWDRRKNMCVRGGETSMQDMIDYNCITDPVDGGWSEWTPVGACSSTCGTGHIFMKRSCTNPQPLNGGDSCEGHVAQTVACHNDPCEDSAAFDENDPLPFAAAAAAANANCAWQSWSEWSNCDCSTETQSAVRVPVDSESCDASVAMRTQSCSCNQQTQCTWTSWSSWSSCDCENEQVFRLRAVVSGKCDGNSDTTYDSCSCVDDDLETNCQWQPWSAWGPCDCGTGQATSTALSGADACKADSRSRSKACTCDSQCQWQEWSDWSLCDCNTQKQNRSQKPLTKPKCNNPAATAEKPCQCSVPEWGIYITQNPNLAVDYVTNTDDNGSGADGADANRCTWGQWSEWSTCDCDSMTMGSTRNATNNYCVRKTDTQLMNCLCPDNNGNGNSNSDAACQWEQWSAWSSCDCTTSTVSSTRYPVEGTVCESGNTYREQPCVCISVDPQSACTWNVWSAWSACNCENMLSTSTRTPVNEAKCGSGEQNRHQVCTCSIDARFPLSVRFTINILPETFDSKGFAHQMAVLLNVSDSKVVIQDMQPVNGQTTVTVLFSTTAANALDRVSSSDLETLGVNGGPKVVISHQYLKDNRSNDNSNSDGSGGSSTLSPLGIGLTAAGATLGAAGIIGLGISAAVLYRRRKARKLEAKDSQAKIEWETSHDSLAPSKEYKTKV